MPSRDTMLSNATTLAAADLPPLKDACAKYILSVMVLFVRQKASDEAEQETILTHHHFDIEHPARVIVMPEPDTNLAPSPKYPYAAQTIRSRTSHASFGSMNGQSGTSIPVPPEARAYSNTPPLMAESASSLNVLVGKYAGIVIYHLSASNWQVVFGRVRGKIYGLERVEKSSADVVDLQIMTECALDRVRLVQLMQGRL
jgi:hypothetical protein